RWSPYRRGDIDAAGFASCCGLLACTFPVGRLDPALRRPGLPRRRRAATKVPWYLPWPDFHRLVIVSFQDARRAALPRSESAVFHKPELGCSCYAEDIPQMTHDRVIRSLVIVVLVLGAAVLALLLLGWLI